MDSTPTDNGTDVLLARVATRDRSAFERLYRSTSSTLFAICLRVLPNRTEAEDVLQEVYVLVWNKAPQFDAGRASALAWLASIARHRAIDRLRSGAAEGRASVELPEDLRDPTPSPADRAEATNVGARLEQCMERLDERRRSLVRTAFFEAATYEELARRIGAPLGSVKSWIRRSLLQLRACLDP